MQFIRFHILKKLAGRIKLDKYKNILNTIVYDVFDAIIEFKNKKSGKVNIGEYNFEINNKNNLLYIDLDFGPSMYEAKFFGKLSEAGTDRIVFYTKRIEKEIQELKILDKKPLIHHLAKILEHEITHLIDAKLSPIYNVTYKDNEFPSDENNFYGTFERFVANNEFGILIPKNKLSENLKNETIEKHCYRFFNNLRQTNKFKNLLKNFNIQLNQDVKLKLISIIIELAYNNESKNADHFYFNSSMEVKAFLTMIIRELKQSGDKDKSNIEAYLNKNSYTFRGIKKYLNETSMKFILKEVAKFLSTQDNNSLNLTPQEQLQLKYLIYLDKTNNHKKMLELYKDKRYENAVAAFKDKYQ